MYYESSGSPLPHYIAQTVTIQVFYVNGRIGAFLEANTVSHPTTLESVKKCYSPLVFPG